jgi:hypothetical protein
MGISGHVYATGKPMIVSDVQSMGEYNSFIDVASNLPVYFYPIIWDKGYLTYFFLSKIGPKKQSAWQSFR